MSLLSVTVKKARFVGAQAQHYNTYVTLKLQNVKSTTVTVKGANPCWEQDFLFETNDVNTGLLVEVWTKGLIWDESRGYHYIPLPEVSYSNEDGSGQWISLDSEVEMRGGEVVGTKNPTGNTLLIDCRFELPFDPENTEAADLQRKLELLNNIMGQEARAEQARRQILYIGHSGYSEDSDYTSDLNYPVGGQGANSSASQFRTAANQLATPQRSLETSRENSYERDDHQIPATVGGRLAAGSHGGYGGRGHSPRYDEPYPEEGRTGRYTTPHTGESSEPLFYNSRPRHYKEYRRRKHTWDQDDSQDGWYSEGYQDYHGTRTTGEGSIFSELDFLTSTTTSIASKKRGRQRPRRPSLERQTTLYDEHSHYPQDTYVNNQHQDATVDPRTRKLSATYPESFTDISYNEYYDPVAGYGYQDERYGQDEEDRQWDSGGKWYPSGSTHYENFRNRRKNLPQRPASSIGIHRPEYRPAVTRQRSYDSEEMDYSGPTSRRRKTLQPQRRSMSRQEGTGKKLPPTPTKPSSVMVGKKPASLPATPGRQLPRTRTPSEEGYYKSDYNEDYNYAYQSQDNLPQDIYTDNVYGESYLGLKDAPYQPPFTQSYAEVYNTATGQGQGIYDQGVVGQYSQEYEQGIIQDGSYTEPVYHAQQTYDQGKPIGYQEPYQDSYEQTTLDNYGEVIQDPYQKGLQTQSNTEYQQDPRELNNTETQYTEAYKQTPIDNFQDQYTGQYDAQFNVPTSVSYDQSNLAEGNYRESFDQNNAQTDAYDSSIYQKPYESVEENYQDKYEERYDIPTSVTYSDGYQEPFKQESVPVSQGEYEEQQVYKEQDPYPGQYEEYKDTYGSEGQDGYKDEYESQYQDYPEQYEDSYPDSYQGSFDKYKESEMAETQRRQSEVPELSVTTPRGQTRSNGYPSSESEYFYPSQDAQNASPLGSSRKKKLSKREASPLQQQNTDSLESRDDELKESFETAVSSIGSSQPMRGFSEYSTAGDSSPAAATLVDSPQGQTQNQTTMGNHVIGSQANGTGTVVTTAVVHNGTAMTTTSGKRLARTESYHSEPVEEEYQDAVPSEPRRKDSQMSHQSQMSQQSVHSQKPQLVRGESYASEHMSRDDSYENLSRKDSYATSVRRDSYGSIHTQDDFKPPLNRTDSYQQRELARGSSYAQNFNAPQPISRAESYQRGYFKQQDSMEDTDIVLSNTVNGEYKMRDETHERYQRGEEALIRGSRENSLVEPYKGTPPRSHSISPQGSVIKQASLDESVQMDTPPRSPPEPPADEELLDLVGSVPVPTQLKERTEMNAKQRWHWAYNKIIMQLNVSLVFS